LFKSAGIIVNADKDPSYKYACEVKAFLREREIEVPNNVDTADFLIVLGGDGTMLRAAQKAAKLDTPMIGINLGTLGFLTDVEKEHGLTAIDKVLDGEYSAEKRMMLTAEFGSRICSALNEFYVGGNGKLRTFSVYVNDEHIDDIRADGILVATPTGSTALNLSAGGPILIPGGQMMVLTPVCPHSLSARPLVLDAADIVTIKVLAAVHIVVDGEILGRLNEVKIQRADFFATILKTESVNFYDILRKKKIL